METAAMNRMKELGKKTGQSSQGLLSGRQRAHEQSRSTMQPVRSSWQNLEKETGTVLAGSPTVSGRI